MFTHDATCNPSRWNTGGNNIYKKYQKRLKDSEKKILNKFYIIFNFLSLSVFTSIQNIGRSIHLTVTTVKNSHILAEIYFIFLKKLLKPNLKVLQNQIWTSKERSKICQTIFSNYQIVKISQVWRELGRVRSKKLFPETTTEKIFEENCSFRVTQHAAGKVLLLFWRNLLVVLTKFSFWEESGHQIIIPWSFWCKP